MEAAISLRQSRVSVLPDRVVVDALVVMDPVAVELVRTRVEAGEDPGRVVGDAIEIGARVLDREQTGVNADFVRSEFERSARDLDKEFVERARKVAERLDQKVDEVFGAEHGHVTKALERHFGDESSVAVQNRVRTLLAEASVGMREDLRKQFSSDSESNPLAGFQRASLAVIKQSSDQQADRLGKMTETIQALQIEVERLRADKVRAEEVAAEADRGTAKGRTFEEAVFEAIDSIAHGQGDDCDSVGDVRGAGGRKGDVLVGIDGCAGPSRGRIVFEAKSSSVGRRKALDELDEAIATRDADYGIWVVPSESDLPTKTAPLREVNGNKLFVTYDPQDGSRLALQVAYSLARARVLLARGGQETVDAPAVRAEVERAVSAMEDVRRIKSTLTTAGKGLLQAQALLEAMAENVRAHLAAIADLLDAADDPVAGGEAPRAEPEAEPPGAPAPGPARAPAPPATFGGGAPASAPAVEEPELRLSF